MTRYNAMGEPISFWRSGRLLLGLLLVAGVATAGVAAARDRGGRPPTTGPSTGYLLDAGHHTRLGCLDPTTSTESSFARGIKADLAAAVAGLAPPKGPVHTRAGSPGEPVARPRPHVDLVIRQISTKALSSNRETTRYGRQLSVPAVPGLRQRPDPNAPNAESALAEWDDDYRQVQEARRQARRAALAGGAAIRQMPLDDSPRNLSGVSACLSALILTAPSHRATSYAIFSDLEETVPAQLQGDAGGAPLLVVQPCPSGDARHCAEMLRRFRVTAKRLGFGHLDVKRPELARQVIAGWLAATEDRP